MSTKTIVLTGMHRSGTSLVARHLWQSGLHIGEELVPANIGNPLGYYEDQEFLKFHRSVLAKHGVSEFPTERSTASLDFDDLEIEEARTLVSARSQLTTWGWKDPRTSLFLNFWIKYLENGLFLLLVRHPLKVVDSLVQRGTDRVLVKHPIRALKSWYVYNAGIADFINEYPERCVLWDIERLVQDVSAFDDSMRRKFDMELNKAVAFSSYFDRQSFHTGVRSMRVKVMPLFHCATYVRCVKLYQAMTVKARRCNGA